LSFRTPAAILPFDARKEDRLSRPNEGLLQGTLDMLVLKALRLGPMHGWGIAERIESGSLRVLAMNEGSLYPALYRLERQGLVRSEWGTSDHNRRARFYALTPAGRRHLIAERANWERVSEAVNLVLRLAED
jgi:transcriptional regulator